MARNLRFSDSRFSVFIVKAISMCLKMAAQTLKRSVPSPRKKLTVSKHHKLSRTVIIAAETKLVADALMVKECDPIFWILVVSKTNVNNMLPSR